MKVLRKNRDMVRLGDCKSGSCVEYKESIFLVVTCSTVCDGMSEIIGSRVGIVGINIEGGTYISDPNLKVWPLHVELVVTDA